MLVPSVFIFAAAAVTVIFVRENLKRYQIALGLLALALVYAVGVVSTRAGFTGTLWQAAIPLAAYVLLFIWYRVKRGRFSGAFFVIVPSVVIISGYIVAGPFDEPGWLKTALSSAAERTGYGGCTVSGLASLSFILSAMFYLSSPANAIIRGVLRPLGVFPEEDGRSSRHGGDEGERSPEPNTVHDDDDDEDRGADRNAIAADDAKSFVVVIMATDKGKDAAGGGAIIGMLERWIAFVLVLTGQYTALAFVIAAKSIARYKKINEEEKFGEYFLIGTLTSIGIALVFGIIVKKFFA